MSGTLIEFQEEACSCAHAQLAHDDGFGCTEPECPCIAQWVWGDDE